MSIAEKFLTMEYGLAPEDPKEAQSWLEGHGRRFGHFIAGEWRQPAEGQFFDSNDPALGEKLASVAQGSAADISAERCPSSTFSWRGSATPLWTRRT